MHRDNKNLVSIKVDTLDSGLQYIYEFKNGFGVKTLKRCSTGKVELDLLKGGEIFRTADFPDTVTEMNDPQLDSILTDISRY